MPRDYTLLWKVIIYRTNSEASVLYDGVKHFWWEGDRLIVSVPDDSPGGHSYWIWPGAQIDHVHASQVAR